MWPPLWSLVPSLSWPPSFRSFSIFQPSPSPSSTPSFNPPRHPLGLLSSSFSLSFNLCHFSIFQPSPSLFSFDDESPLWEHHPLHNSDMIGTCTTGTRSGPRQLGHDRDMENGRYTTRASFLSSIESEYQIEPNHHPQLNHYFSAHSSGHSSSFPRTFIILYPVWKGKDDERTVLLGRWMSVRCCST